MKLWLKISLLSAIIATLAIGACSFIMLANSGRSSLDLAIQNALANQEARSASWSDAVISRLEGGYTYEALRSLASHLIHGFADKTTVLATGDDMIYNAGEIDPRVFLPIPESTRQYIIRDVENKTLLIAGNAVFLNETMFCFYTISDISAVFSNISEMSYQFAAVNLIVIIMMLAITIIVIKKVLSPIDKLKENSTLIAGGVYDKRLEITGRDEIAELAENFNQMAEAVMRTVSELNDEIASRTFFMTAITHEIKTPLTSIKGNAQTLLFTKLNDEEREEALFYINDACAHMETLSDKLMKLIVLRQKSDFTLARVSVSDLLEDVKKNCREKLDKQGVNLIIENEMDTLYMDCDLFLSLLINLVDNAVKASSAGDSIFLSAKGNVFIVKDSGKGIPADELPKITRPFYMVDKSRAKKSGGIGLGLALCEEIARLHGARLEFESRPGNGTTAKVVFDI